MSKSAGRSFLSLFAAFFLIPFMAGAVAGQTRAPKLVAKFSPSHECEDDHSYFDELHSALDKEPDTTGWILISPDEVNMSYAFAVEKQMRDSFLNTSIDAARIVFVRMPPEEKQMVSLWITRGADPPPTGPGGEVKDREWSYELPAAKKPFIFYASEVGEYRSCFDQIYPTFLDTLKANPEMRGNIVIYAYSRARYNERKKELVGLAVEKGIEGGRIRTFYVYRKGVKFEMGRYTEEPELWLLP